mgnify:CR=1 FL=1
MHVALSLLKPLASFPCNFAALSPRKARQTDGSSEAAAGLFSKAASINNVSLSELLTPEFFSNSSNFYEFIYLQSVSRSI